jgi:integrase
MIEKRKLKNGRHMYRVRWREGGRGSKEHVRAFDRKEHAERLETEIRRRKQLGELATFDRGKLTLDEFARGQWWPKYGSQHLARKTQLTYAELWDRHILGRLGGVQLRHLTPAVVEAFQAELRAAGVGEATILKALTLLQGMCRKAVVWGEIASNPVQPVNKPSQRRTRTVRPLSPTDVERLRDRMPSERDAALVSVMAYAGLRPGEALALRWGDVGERTILVERSLALGQEKGTKTGTVKPVRLLGPLKADLHAYRMKLGRPADDRLIFSRADGEPWRDEDYRNWRKRVFKEAATAADLWADVRPYDLRHSFVSLLIREGKNILEVARQARHSPKMTLDVYGHVFEELEGAKPIPAEEAIRAARRATLVRPHGGAVASSKNEAPLFAGLS